MQLTLTLNMTTAQAVEMSVTFKSSPIQNYTHPDDYIPLTYDMTPGLKPFTEFVFRICKLS